MLVALLVSPLGFAFRELLDDFGNDINLFQRPGLVARVIDRYKP